jgi:hypothetical protein
MNIAVVAGVVSADIDLRTLNDGTLAYAFDLKTGLAGAAGTVPVSWIDPPSRVDLVAGDEVLVVGHVQKRFYRVGAQTVAKTELLVHSLTPVRAKRRISTVLGDVVDEVLSRIPAA